MLVKSKLIYNVIDPKLNNIPKWELCTFSAYFSYLQRTRKLVFLCVCEIHSVSLSCLLT